MGLYFKSINESIAEEKERIRKIRSGELKPLDTGYRIINNTLLRGIFQEDILLIGGLSGTGKTAFVGKLMHNLVTLNQNVRVCNMTFEMSSGRLLARSIARENKLSTRDIYDKDSLIDLDYFDEYKDLPIDFVENPSSIVAIAEGMKTYCQLHQDKHVVFIIDHTLLVDNLRGDGDMDTLNKISVVVNKLKKTLKCSFILVSQLNDKMLSAERKLPAKQYPNQTDIYGAKSIYHVCDGIYILSSPMDMGILTKYGPHSLPVSATKTEGQNKVVIPYIYLHTIKAREGEKLIEPFFNKLGIGTIQELSSEQIKKFKEKYGI